MFFPTVVEGDQERYQKGYLAHGPAKGCPEGKRQCHVILDNCQTAENGTQKDKGQNLQYGIFDRYDPDHVTDLIHFRSKAVLQPANQFLHLYYLLFLF
jgi:hypothetical protein